MKRKRFSVEQIVGVPKQAEVGVLMDVAQSSPILPEALAKHQWSLSMAEVGK